MKRLYKNRANAKVSGVCQGVAEYFDLDPSIVRILWVVLSFPSFGVSLIIYIACAVILPDKSELEFKDYTVKDMDEK